MLNSAIYQGVVSHQRHLPKPHCFSYRVFMMYLDLDELPDLFKGYKRWSYQIKNWAYFKRADYYGDPQQPLKQEISSLVNQATGSAPRGPIRLLTNMRYFGHCFNPVSFYYCFEADGVALQAIVSHITNTPWGDNYAYVHDFNYDKSIKKTNNSELIVFKIEKNFHVSPFMPMNIDYHWAFQFEAGRLLINMKSLQHGTEIFNAVLALKRSEINEKTLNWLLISYPFMTIKVIGAIYWNALMLWFKGTPFYSRPQSSAK